MLCRMPFFGQDWTSGTWYQKESKNRKSGLFQEYKEGDKFFLGIVIKKDNLRNILIK